MNSEKQKDAMSTGNDEKLNKSDLPPNALDMADKIITEYIDFGHFRNPEEAKPYLIEGCHLGILQERKLNEAIVAELKEKLSVRIYDGLIEKIQDLQSRLDAVLAEKTKEAESWEEYYDIQTKCLIEEHKKLEAAEALLGEAENVLEFYYNNDLYRDIAKQVLDKLWDRKK